MYKILQLSFFLFFLETVSFGSTITSTTSGNWASALTWASVSMTGTITTSTTTINISGAGTSFLTELAVGSILITSGGNTIGTVANIASNTSLTLVANANSNNTDILYKAQVVPTSKDDVLISDGTTVTLNVSAVMRSVIVNNGATLNVNSGLVFKVGSETVLGNFTVNSGGMFSLGSGSDKSTVIVYGNYTNYGETIFYKSDVLIRGNLITPSTSSLQNNGNVIVGGDIIGKFDISGQAGAGIIYALDPYATVDITPTSINNNVIPGTFPSGETAELIGIVNTVIYGGDCTFIVNNISNATVCSGSNVVFTVSTSGTTPTYQWQVNTNGSGWVNLTNGLIYSGVTTSNLTIIGVDILMNNFKYRAKITAGSPTTCTKNGNYGILTVNASALTITTQPISQLDCEGASVKFKAVASGTGLTFTWQRKKPLDSNFITIPVEGNISYPSIGEIKVDNVGSAQSPSGTLYQVIVNNSSGCSVTSTAATLLVNEITGVTGSTTVTQCYGTGYTYTVSTSTPSPGYVVSYKWKSSVAFGSWNDVVDGVHFTGATTATLKILNGTPSESGEYRVFVTFHSSGADCNVSSTSRTRLITFQPLLLTPSVNVIQPTCNSAFGTITVTVQTSSDTYSFDNGLSYQISNIKSGLVVGNYNVIIKNLSGCISSTRSVTLKSANNVWNGSVWSNSTSPISTENIEFNANYTSTADILACSCTVTSGIVTIPSGNNLILDGKLTVTSPGSLIFEDSSSLVQKNTFIGANTGNIIYKRYASIRNTDYTYWSSPVKGYTLGGVSQNKTLSDKYYSFNSILENWQQESAATVMTNGIGYIVRGPEPIISPPIPAPLGIYEASFVGEPNNGNLLITSIISDKSYLLGNPYPSAISADLFLAANAGVLNGTIYFWTHNTKIGTNVSNPGSGVIAYSNDDYATYNATGGVGASLPDLGSNTSAAPSGNTGINNNTIPNGSIAVGQGFFGSSKTTLSGSSIVFNNRMRLAGGTTLLDGSIVNGQFFKTRNPKIIKTIEKKRIWLNLTNTQGAFKQILIGYITDATNEYDERFDGESFDGNEFLDFYSINTNKNLVIQGRSLPFEENDEVPLGYRTTIDGNFTINIGQVDDSFINQAVFIEDKLTNTVFDLKNGNYTFSTVTGTFNDRFILKYKSPEKTLGSSDLNFTENKVLVSCKNKQIKIYSFVESIIKVTIYDLLGKQIFQKNNINNFELSIANLVPNHQTFIVKTSLLNGKIVTNKIIF
ncbi:T9SS sorting signal type C domain-containing protein [Flavobacterium cellulosilyticum]|uniref:T9SS sorting signal type C domain-containing protein n=1 Tax=Flavobacterium cellulosilyticum TaxID=2541731 RepID=A0A4R5CPP0_9FLAO|nr:T9SS sorting signal type C domain-containing protein [Flavobacterium cellulosilyticum]TDD99604.1 T9SS sorting signal type C domain-containing protein [Flavobacterium cellulosilyticum]